VRRAIAALTRGGGGRLERGPQEPKGAKSIPKGGKKNRWGSAPLVVEDSTAGGASL